MILKSNSKIDMECTHQIQLYALSPAGIKHPDSVNMPLISRDLTNFNGCILCMPLY